VVRRPDGDLEVAFPDVGDPRLLATVRLPDVVTVHALTIHKSQGSEYDHVVVVLPKGESRLLTRELLYTAASRARLRLTIVSTTETVHSAMTTRVRRSTGLADRLTR
jgi:exodeoxyribonuclease V alpha subunit